MISGWREPGDWWEHAACKGNYAFTRTEQATPRELVKLVAICNSLCPVLDECRADMEATDGQVGVRAGVAWTTPNQRHGRPEPSRLVTGGKVCAWCQRPYVPGPKVRNSRYCSGPCQHKGTLRQKRLYEASRRPQATNDRRAIRAVDSAPHTSGGRAASTAGPLADTAQGGVDMEHGTRDARQRAESGGH